MMSRGARAERQANLRLLESVQQETDEKRKQLEAKYEAIPILSAEQAEVVVARILAMTPDAIIEFFQHYRLRMAGENSFYYIYGPSRDTRHDDDPEMAAAVERVNLALNAYDDALLDLRIAELFGGRVPSQAWRGPSECAERSFSTYFTLDMFEILVSAAKAISYYEVIAGRDVLVAERETFQQVLLPFIRSRAKRYTE